VRSGLEGIRFGARVGEEEVPVAPIARKAFEVTVPTVICAGPCDWAKAAAVAARKRTNV
jgi:hypothetical protein